MRSNFMGNELIHLSCEQQQYDQVWNLEEYIHASTRITMSRVVGPSLQERQPEGICYIHASTRITISRVVGPSLKERQPEGISYKTL
ncbi:hypothetical protein T265_03455 [Opisthorchis viverrini]|uniref:Uncharacterized protein n=1 Tax=Opisthorchis viverrini TaxID=6198 RepID=A0A074ZRP7_OPIVI|nr:hypothetical protein T265_03455 [Opisthorchis viverrini]KER30093.1 hypothetical protein T265_03455 [Opisthorchis viverrini]